MIEIINNPNPKTPPRWRGVCEECACEFSYRANDVLDDWNGRCGVASSGGPYVHCPNCGARVWTPMNDCDLITE